MDLRKFYIENAVYPAMTLLQQNRVTAYTKNFQQSQYLSAEQQASDLRQKLTDLLFLCRDQVPAYTDLPFTDLELRREPLDCLQAVDPLPLADFLAEAPQHLCRDADPENLIHCRYTPEELMPADLYLTQQQMELYEAARWRGLSWYGVTFGSRSVLLWDKPRDPFILQEEPYMKNRLRLSVCALTDRSVRPLLEEIDRFQPEYLSGSASGLASLAEHMEQTGLRLQTNLKVITVTQGVADKALRQRLSQVFACPVAQNLGVRPEGVIAYMCPEGHLHVSAENSYVELLDPLTLNPVTPGKRGVVTVTGLVNDIMPHLRLMLRYTAVWDEEPCSCGRTLPVLRDLEEING